MPDTTGAEPIFSPAYEPVWQAAESNQMPISLHIGHGGSLAAIVAAMSASKRDAGNPLSSSGSGTGIAEMFFTMTCLDMAEPVSLLIFSGVVERYPDCSSRSPRAASVGYLRDRADGLHIQSAPVLDEVRHQKEPSHYFRHNFHATFQQDEETGLLARHISGVETLMWASDYPHTDSTWPYSRKVVDELFAHVPEDECKMITSQNAARLYRIAV